MFVCVRVGIKLLHTQIPLNIFLLSEIPRIHFNSFYFSLTDCLNFL